MANDMINRNETNEWIFPEMDLLQEEENEFGELIDGNNPEEEEDDFEFGEPAPKAPVVDLAKESMDAKIAELTRNNELLLTVLAKIKEPLAFLDDQIINILQDIIKKITLKIIGKELKSDPELVKKIIDDLKSLIFTQNGLINIYLSEEDYTRLNLPAESSDQAIHIDKALTEGDIVINSKDTEIRALLNDRIELLMGTLHD